ncbi:MAG TPA: hypothetical protein PLD79_04650 [Halothiobacillus sp.]|nr:MAG: hypothetical protein B7Z82_02785 [Halothiobacillus sp. 20-54-6]HQT43266.1 hypothetical protein [Halothiobacillus sp.]
MLPSEQLLTLPATKPEDMASNTICRYPEAICAQLRWLQRRVFYQFLQTGCPTIDLEADLDIQHNQADLTQRLAVPVPPIQAMPALLRGSVRHAHSFDPTLIQSSRASQGIDAS